MSYAARVFRILIASPSDVLEERDIAVNTIQAWNDLISAERQIVLLPLRWESHSAPEYGTRPQEVINRQVVDYCDVLVGIFWTRIGSPTGAADSGTLEEIERVASQGKPVMLYFSRSRQDPDLIDVDQLKQLRDFKLKTFPNGLVETYATQIEFRDKLQKQLEIQLRALLAAENQAPGDSEQAIPTTDILFEFADVERGRRAGERLALQTTAFEVRDVAQLPDFTVATAAQDPTGLITNPVNPDYYREMANHLISQGFFTPIRFWLRNDGSLGARDVYVDVRIASKDTQLSIDSFERLRGRPPTPRGHKYTFYGGLTVDGTIPPEKFGGAWTTKLELSALQPKREVSPPPTFILGANQGGSVDITARIYADTLPEPLVRTLSVDLAVTTVKKSARSLLEESGIKVPGSSPASRRKKTEGAG